MLLRDFNKMYCINLPKRLDRKTRCEEIFKEFKLDVQFVEAVDGTTLQNIGELKPGAAGCCMSHKKVFEMILADQSIKTALIMEDDVEFDRNLGNRFQEYYQMVPKDWQMLYFGGSHRHNPIMMINRHVHKLRKTYTTHCYAIKRAALDMIMERFSDNVIFTKPADLHLAFLQKKMPCYGFRPHIAWQRADHSDIENTFKDYRNIR